jgi:hypothetical protein
MLSSVFVSGRLGALIDEKTRYVEVDRVIPGPSGHFETDQLPVRSMLCIDGSFMKGPKGTFIVFKGRIESDPKLGLILIDELDEIYTTQEPLKRI